MLIIFGIRSRLADLGRGEFYCPRCRADREYVRKGIRRWFTLFFIPLIPLGAARSPRIVCVTCNGAFSEDVLALPAGPARADAAREAVRRCALAVLNSGDPQSTAARRAFDEAMAARGGSPLDDSELAGPRADDVAVYLAPIANTWDTAALEGVFADCGRIALADGPLSSPEQLALDKVGESLHMSTAYQRGVIDTLVNATPS